MSLKKNQQRSNLFINVLLAAICLLWLLPTFGLLVSSFRTGRAIQESGWWNIFPHREWIKTSEMPAPTGTGDAPITIEGVTATFEQFRAGVESNGKRLRWEGNRRLGTIFVEEQKWTMDTRFTTSNYQAVILGDQYKEKAEDGTERAVTGNDIGPSFINTAVVAIPSTIIPILIAAFAAYAFSWMNFIGKRILFVAVVALLVVPLQVAMVPILRDFGKIGINGTYLAVWLAHITFGLPLATYLLYNYISQLPHETMEAAYMDGASHFTTFTKLVLPLSVPALASFAIFQFIWVWNDFLVSLIFLGPSGNLRVMTARLTDMIGSRGQDWHYLTAGAFVTMLVPLIVFLSMQRYFVRGLLAGSVKG
jgi:alpha-glucoside transport system permease protein